MNPVAPSRPPVPDAVPPDRYRGIVLVLWAASLLGMVASFWAAVVLANVILLDTAILLLIAAGVLIGVLLAQQRRARPAAEVPSRTAGSATATASSSGASRDDAVVEGDGTSNTSASPAWRLPADLPEHLRRRAEAAALPAVRVVTGGAATLMLLVSWFVYAPPVAPTWQVATAVMAAAAAAAGIAMTAARYLDAIDPATFPEAPALCQGARLVGWYFVLGAASVALAWGLQFNAIHTLRVLTFVPLASLCVGMLAQAPASHLTFPLDFPVLSIVGSRPNAFAAVLDAAERQMGIDLRSTWALAVVRRSLEPLVLGMCLLGWLSTSLTAVRPDEQVLVERLGVAVGGAPLGPGLHLHWFWPIDRVFRIPVTRVQRLGVGHEGEEEGSGPENVLWARQHAANEYTLLLGDGRDLVTIDAAVEYRIRDARAWRYHTQNPADALHAIAYRAVMRSTVNRTLADALSQNIATLTTSMQAMVQREADALGLGVDVVAFTVGGMHPPVPVAAEYQAVVSAELRKGAAVVDANAYRNRTVPMAEAAAVTEGNRARADAVDMRRRSAGEAWAFQALRSGYQASPGAFMFRRRLETLENGLSGRPFTVIDERIQRDGGALWLTR